MKISDVLKNKNLDFASYMGLQLIMMAFGDQELNFQKIKKEYPDLSEIINKIEEETNNG